MPPSTMRLSELVDLSLGTPDIGVVNFNAMHTLFHAIIGHLKITDVETKIGEDIQRERDAQSTIISTRGSGSDQKDGRDGALSRSGSLPSEGEYAERLRQIEDKLSSQETQLNKLNDLPSNTDLLERTRSEGTKPVGEMWQLMQLQRKVEANEAGLTKAMSLIEDLMREVNMLNDNKAKVAKEMKDIKDKLDKMDLTSLSDRISELESYQDKIKKIDQLEKQLAELAEQMKNLPTAEEFDAFVTWPVLDEALREERQKYMETKPTDGTDESGALLEQLKSKDPSRPPSAPRPPSSRLSSAKEKYPEALQALKEMATLSFEHEKLSEQVEKLEVTMPTKADKSELEKLLEAALANQKVDIPEDLLEQLAALRDALDMMKNSRDKLDEHSRILDGLMNAPPELLTPPPTPPPIEGEPEAFSLTHTATPVLPPIPPTHSANDSSHHRKRPTPPTSPVHRMSDTSKPTPPPSPVRRMSDTSKRPLSPVTAMLPPSGPSKKTSSTGRLVQDLNLQIVGLRAKDAELEKDVKSLKDAVSQGMSFAGVPVQDGDMLDNLQQKVLQLLADVEQLNGTSSDLVRKSGDLQKSTEALYKVCDKLNDTKADKDYVTMEVDVKADKRALESKVSRQQFDSSFNELNNLIQELLAKLDGQDGQWQDALKNLSDDLDGKLDRLELDPFKEYIQGQLNKLNRKMAKVSEIEQQKELDEAAGFRKQMFRCISCDRPVTMTAGGPVPALPSTNSLPVTATLRPYTTYELEKIRQEQKTPSVGSEDNATRFQKAMAMRKLAKLKRKNIHLYRLVINQGIDQIMAKLMKKRRHRSKDQLLKCQAARLQPLQGPTLPSLAQPTPQDYDLYFSQPRPCGGSHTMTYPNKRFTKLTAGGQYVVEEQPQVQVFHVKEELDIIGADGHIYKGRVEIDDGRLPTLTQQPKAPVSPGTQRRRVQKSGAFSPRSDQRPSPPGRPQSAHATSPRPGSSNQRPHTAGSRSVSRTSQTQVIDESTGEQQHSPPPTRQATPGEDRGGGAGQTEVSATA
ncbi:glutamine-rich protein 2-like isoform X2 [Branchiostoma lanceolatum]|uniref:glutamine-rich protein 2-like isoform X2 n=1 Tax=Branchiostoma lanceolatum TaxID=7740 RepID=UPI003452E77F